MTTATTIQPAGAMPDHVYEGRRVGDRVAVTVDGKPLDPAPSQAVWNHSPDGFQWGYGGSGPAQLALAILLNEVGREEALRCYQQFKRRVIAGLDDDWRLVSSDVRRIFYELREERDARDRAADAAEAGAS